MPRFAQSHETNEKLVTLRWTGCERVTAQITSGSWHNTVDCSYLAPLSCPAGRNLAAAGIAREIRRDKRTLEIIRIVGDVHSLYVWYA